MSEFESVISELKYIKALLAMDRIRELDSTKDKILFLDKFGFDGQQIAELAGSTTGAVAVAKSQAKKKSNAKPVKKPGQEK